ncbi:MAG TPA: hypothetical protein DGH68_09150 [Bacteroidetes bacterium]|jgi:hypothetical protein|nr:hypothetical protein [Bacteroidota bacterium]
MTLSHNETFSRVFIDKSLEFSEWDLLDDRQVQFKLHTKNGRADHLLKDSLGRIICAHSMLHRVFEGEL